MDEETQLQTTGPIETAAPAPTESATTVPPEPAQAASPEPALDAATTAPEAAAPINPSVEPSASTAGGSVGEDVQAVEHKAEQDTHHAFSHLEAEAVALFITLPETEIKALLAWIASKL